MWQYNNTNELYHFGVRGMHWGVKKASKLKEKIDNAGSERKAKKYQKKLDDLEYEMSMTPADLARRSSRRGKKLVGNMISTAGIAAIPLLMGQSFNKSGSTFVGPLLTAMGGLTVTGGAIKATVDYKADRLYK